jgi:EAL domain-containing protein (putative c-di-GMP-specific phosphodiesterase class I)
MREYFISLEMLRKALFPDANLRRSGQLFGDLTLTLDQAMIRSIKYLPDLTSPFSINLNVQSVFTKNFEVFLAQAPLDLLTIEFRQPNVVEYFDEYLTGRDLLRAKGIRIAIDQIFPDTFGLVNLELIGASMAKIHWGESAAEIFRERQRSFRNILDMGVELVMTRVDETAAFAVGASMGIRKFQGHLIEDLMKKTAA